MPQGYVARSFTNYCDGLLAPWSMHDREDLRINPLDSDKIEFIMRLKRLVYTEHTSYVQITKNQSTLPIFFGFTE